MSKENICISDEVLLHEIGEEAILLNIVTQKYYSLDSVGTRMLHLLLDSPSIEAAVSILIAEYDAEKEQIESDVRELIEVLLQHGLVRLR